MKKHFLEKAGKNCKKKLGVKSMDMSVWYLLGAVLVFFMQCGFAAVAQNTNWKKKLDQSKFAKSVNI